MTRSIRVPDARNEIEELKRRIADLERRIDSRPESRQAATTDEALPGRISDGAGELAVDFDLPHFGAGAGFWAAKGWDGFTPTWVALDVRESLAAELIVQSLGDSGSTSLEVTMESTQGSFTVLSDGSSYVRFQHTDAGGNRIGLFDRASTPVVQQTVTGSRGGNAALASLLDALEAYGLVIDSSS